MGKGARARAARRERNERLREAGVDPERFEIAKQISRHRWMRAPWEGWAELKRRSSDPVEHTVASLLPFQVIEPGEEEAWVTTLHHGSESTGKSLDQVAERLAACARRGTVRWDNNKNAIVCQIPLEDALTLG